MKMGSSNIISLPSTCANMNIITVNETPHIYKDVITKKQSVLSTKDGGTLPTIRGRKSGGWDYIKILTHMKSEDI